MKKYFEELLGMLQAYVDKSVTVRNDIVKINQNPNYSQSKKESDATALKSELVAYGNNSIAKAEKIVDTITDSIVSGADMNEMSGVFGFVTACKGKVDVEVMRSQLKPFRGNMDSLKAIYNVLTANEAPTATVKVCTDLFFNPEDVNSTLKNELSIIFCGAGSATDAGHKLEREAYLLGVDITSTVRDEFTDMQILRKAAGLI